MRQDFLEVELTLAINWHLSSLATEQVPQALEEQDSLDEVKNAPSTYTRGAEKP